MGIRTRRAGEGLLCSSQNGGQGGSHRGSQWMGALSPAAAGVEDVGSTACGGRAAPQHCGLPGRKAAIWQKPVLE